MPNLNFGQLLYTLFARGVTLARNSPATSDEPISATSIRLAPHVRRFYEAQAEALGGISFQAAITMALTGLAEASSGSQYDEPANLFKTVQERFFLLFQEHRIDLMEIPSVLHQFEPTSSQFANPEKLVDFLRPPVINYLAETFGVRTDWLKGTSELPSEKKFNWYKYVPSAIQRLAELVRAGNRVDVIFLRKEGADFAAALNSNDDSSSREPVGIVLRIYRKTPDEVSYTTYEKWAFERWSYWRCRQQLKLLMTFCDQASANYVSGLSYVGLELLPEVFDLLDNNKCLPVTALTKWRHGAVWHPEDYGSLRKDWVTKEKKDFDDNVLSEYGERNLDQYLDGKYWYRER